uniref:Putative secreted protein n=1 Tax=Anopheles darlingi TaxID=43151 RepID=A0A2M4DJK2_ANODA
MAFSRSLSFALSLSLPPSLSMCVDVKDAALPLATRSVPHDRVLPVGFCCDVARRCLTMHFSFLAKRIHSGLWGGGGGGISNDAAHRWGWVAGWVVTPRAMQICSFPSAVCIQLKMHRHCLEGGEEGKRCSKADGLRVARAVHILFPIPNPRRALEAWWGLD